MTNQDYYNTHIDYVIRSLGINRTIYNDFKLLGSRLHNIYERQCNGHQDINGNWDEIAEKIDENRENRLYQRAKDKADKFLDGLSFYSESSWRIL